TTPRLTLGDHGRLVRARPLGEHRQPCVRPRRGLAAQRYQPFGTVRSTDRPLNRGDRFSVKLATPSTKSLPAVSSDTFTSAVIRLCSLVCSQSASTCCLIVAIAIGEQLAARSLAYASVVGSRSSGSTTRLTRPRRSASSGSTTRADSR